MNRLKELLVIPNEATKEVIQKRFELLAKMLLGEYEIIKGNIHYNILEIEFYFYNHHHRDTSTYKRTIDAGKWFPHLSGVDISFQSDMENCYGGILIRSLVDTNNERFINGPLLSMIELFNNIDIEEENINIPVIRKRRFFDNTIIESTKRYNINDNLEYCYYNASKTIQWKSSYRANPLKRML